MKKLYYFSKSKLQFIEIKNYKAKLAAIFSFAVLIFSFIIFGGYYLINSFVGNSSSFISLKDENKALQENLDKAMAQFKILDSQLDSLSKVNNQLRLATNLQPLSNDENMLGIGGGSFDNYLDFLKNPSEKKLKQLMSYVDEVSRKVSFEKNQYKEISQKLAENQKLYKAIPAIKPCMGSIGDVFGMRLHPILHIWRMHDGIDIITDVNSPVYAPGDGVVEFVGNKEGYGLCIEINHGFGYETLYGHLLQVEVKDGQKVFRGEEIAKTGDSGLSTGPHLHYEVHHDGVKLNPEDFFFGDTGFYALTKKN
jgi:murein DD-endopeptidase MepM/ murein hydrolase activator NlpD